MHSSKAIQMVAIGQINADTSESICKEVMAKFESVYAMLAGDTIDAKIMVYNMTHKFSMPAERVWLEIAIMQAEES